MFTQEGNPAVIIIETAVAESKFGGAEAFDICLKVQHKDDVKQTDWWRGEMSSNYCKAASMAHLTQAAATFETLGKLGFKGGQDLTRLDELINVETTAWVKASDPTDDGKIFYNVRALASGGGRAPEKIDMGLAAARMKAIMGGATTTPAATAEEEPTAEANPFL